MPAIETHSPSVTPERVKRLTSPEGKFVIECFDIPTWDYAGMVRGFDPEFADGDGWIDLTQDKSEALRFTDFLDAVDCWKMASRRKPVREDGKPNRPMTTYTIAITKFEDAPKRGLVKT